MVQSEEILGMLLDFSQHTHPEKFTEATTSFDKAVLRLIQKWHKQDTFSVCTSGSTGIPKKIMHSKAAMQESALLTGNYFNFQRGNSVLLCLPVDKIGGMMLVVRALIWKLKLYTLSPKLQLPIVELPPIDFASLLPAQAVANYQQLHHIKKILLGGAALPANLENKLQELSTSCYLSYGMTETLSHIALRKINGRRKASYFTTLPGISIKIDSEARMCIRAPKLGVENLQTNDIVNILSPTTFEFVGRYDNIINSGGFKINAEEIEKQLTTYITQPFYIKGTPDTKLGEKVTLFIEGEKWNAEQLKILEIHIHSLSPKQARPKTIIFQEKFNYTPTGKIKK